MSDPALIMILGGRPYAAEVADFKVFPLRAIRAEWVPCRFADGTPALAPKLIPQLKILGEFALTVGGGPCPST